VIALRARTKRLIIGLCCSRLLLWPVWPWVWLPRTV
jgi:hypothetical protein